MWEEMNLGTDLEYALDIIYDALCYCFEFKVENHKIYFKEIE